MIEPAQHRPPHDLVTLDSKLISTQLAGRLPVRPSILFFETTPSTMRVLDLAAEKGVEVGPWQVYVAGLQVDGQGRSGAWKQTHEDLAMTVVVPDAESKEHHHLLMLAEGISVAYALRDVSGLDDSQFYMKWPNDVHVMTTEGSKKISGILDHSFQFNDYGFGDLPGLRAVGIGINISREVLNIEAKYRGEQVPLHTIATSLEQVAGIRIENARERLIARFLLHYHHFWTNLTTEPASFFEEVSQYMATQRGRVYSFETASDEMFEGMLIEIGAAGITVWEGVSEATRTIPFSEMKRYARRLAA